jgi:hypothetical protein
MTYYLITCDINALYRTGTGSVQDRPNALYRGGKARTCPLPPLYGAVQERGGKGNTAPVQEKRACVRPNGLLVLELRTWADLLY